MNINHLPSLELEASLASVSTDDSITSIGGVVIGVITGIIAGLSADATLS